MNKLDGITSWHSDWTDLRVVVFGLGVSGFSVVDTLRELGSEVLVVAESANPDYLDLLGILGASEVIGEPFEQALPTIEAFKADLAIISPGFSPSSPEVKWAHESELPIWIDIDLAWRLRDKVGKAADWLCVTGTNGKTTTVQLATHILQTAGLRAMACGNIGVPILDAVRDENGFDVLVVELSSFQLHYLGEIRPFAAAVLNVELDHLDWHGSFDAYSASKAKIFENVESACVYNLADPKILRMVETADVQEGARAIGFGLAFPGPSNIGFVEDILVDNAFSPMRKAKEIEPLATIDQISRVGVVSKHLLQNVAAAAALTRSYGVPARSVGEGISTFKMDAHRIELILERDGISFVDDSKATNPHATAASLDSFESVIWIVGGLLKGVDISSLVSLVSDRVKAAVVIGVERSAVLDAFASVAPQIPLVEVSDGEDVMGRALQAAIAFAGPGDTVLLAPAAASMDQFKDYSDRGNKFSDAVRKHFGIKDEK
jgi:UDP-N-acetylmuramoylalanine--D-glutamate ligase